MKISSLAIILCLVLPLAGQQPPPSGASTRLHYALLNDISGKTLWPNGIEQQVNLEGQFLTQVVKAGTDVGSLVNFADNFFLDVQNSTNPDDIKAKLVRHQLGGTQVFDAVVAAADWLDKFQFPDSRKAIFLFSDGDDTTSMMSLKKTITAVQALHISVFVIAPAAVEHKRQGKDLHRLASATGGHVYFISKADIFDFAALKHDLGR